MPLFSFLPRKAIWKSWGSRRGAFNDSQPPSPFISRCWQERYMIDHPRKANKNRMICGLVFPDLCVFLKVGQEVHVTLSCFSLFSFLFFQGGGGDPVFFCLFVCVFFLGLVPWFGWLVGWFVGWLVGCTRGGAVGRVFFFFIAPLFGVVSSPGTPKPSATHRVQILRELNLRNRARTKEDADAPRNGRGVESSCLDHEIFKSWWSPALVFFGLGWERFQRLLNWLVQEPEMTIKGVLAGLVGSPKAKSVSLCSAFAIELLVQLIKSRESPPQN